MSPTAAAWVGPSCRGYHPQQCHTTCGVENVAPWFIYFPQQINNTRFALYHEVTGEQLDITAGCVLRAFRKLKADWAFPAALRNSFLLQQFLP